MLQGGEFQFLFSIIPKGFADNLFNIFDSNDQYLLSVQELVGGFGLLIQ